METTKPTVSQDAIEQVREDLIEFITGKWYHLKINFKFGYSTSQNPLTQIYIDNKIIYTSLLPNSYNDKAGIYWKYGIYSVSGIPKSDTDFTVKLYYDNIFVMN
jgi:hypothetical protein